jgi:hypothetical protein
MENSIHKKIKKRIYSSLPGSVFVPSDFADIASQSTASKSLCRLCDAGLLCHLMQGVFWLPDNGSHPSPDKVAHAIARSKDWRIMPCGKTALYILGLESDRPKKWTYVTNGTYRRYSYGNYKIEFNNTVSRFMDALSDSSAMLVQVLEAYGKKNVSEELLKTIRSYFEDAEAIVLEEIHDTTDWIADAVIKMFS